jgi:AcrR family transcriptional regulator
VKIMSDDNDNDNDIPASIAAAWGMYDRPRKGPKPGLSLEKIVEAAVRLAGTEGLAAVSMHRVAVDLGTSAMTLYRYVAAKDELLTLMFDAISGAPTAPLAPGEGWREGLTRWAWGVLTTYRRHPWALYIPISGPPATPNQIAWMEQGLHYLANTGLTASEKMSVIILLSGFVRNEASLSASLSAAVHAAGSTEQQMMAGYRQLLARVTENGRFPALQAVIEAGALDRPDTPDEEFEFGLERILDGIAVLMRARGFSG